MNTHIMPLCFSHQIYSAVSLLVYFYNWLHQIKSFSHCAQNWFVHTNLQFGEYFNFLRKSLFIDGNSRLKKKVYRRFITAANIGIHIRRRQIAIMISWTGIKFTSKFTQWTHIIWTCYAIIYLGYAFNIFYRIKSSK